MNNNEWLDILIHFVEEGNMVFYSLSCVAYPNEWILRVFDGIMSYYVFSTIFVFSYNFLERYKVSMQSPK